MKIESLLKHAPDLPEYQADFMAIQFEPIELSGERITIAVAAQSKSEFKVIQSLSPELLKCMYGKKAVNIQGFITLAVESLSEHLTAGHTLSQWQSPLGGVASTQIISSRSAKGMEGILFQAFTSFASLYQGNLVTNPIKEMLNTEDESNFENQSQRLITQVKECMPKPFKDRFNKKIVVHNGSEVAIDYLGINLNACMTSLDVRQPASAVQRTKAKLLDLEVLKEFRAKEGLNDNQKFELLINLNQTEAQQKDIVGNLINLADTLEIMVRGYGNVTDIAEYIVQAEKAS